MTSSSDPTRHHLIPNTINTYCKLDFVTQKKTLI